MTQLNQQSMDVLHVCVHSSVARWQQRVRECKFCRKGTFHSCHRASVLQSVQPGFTTKGHDNKTPIHTSFDPRFNRYSQQSPSIRLWMPCLRCDPALDAMSASQHMSRARMNDDGTRSGHSSAAEESASYPWRRLGDVVPHPCQQHEEQRMRNENIQDACMRKPIQGFKRSTGVPNMTGPVWSAMRKQPQQQQHASSAAGAHSSGREQRQKRRRETDWRQ